MKNYKEVDKIYDDIRNLVVQGATNVCIATFEAMKMYLDITEEKDANLIYEECIQIGKKLAHARDNEPLARNGVKYVEYAFANMQKDGLFTQATMKKELTKLCTSYLDLIDYSKTELLNKASREFYNYNYKSVFTHCHSSTAVDLIKFLAKQNHDFRVVCTETRPLFQGRLTEKALVNAGIGTTMVGDSAAESFIIGRGSVNVQAVFIGCDQITRGGYAINKIGSWGIASAAKYVKKPVFVVTPSLKLDRESIKENVHIEVRKDEEMWKDAPKELDIYNPAFELVDASFITGYITELGLIKPKDLQAAVEKQYPWII